MGTFVLIDGQAYNTDTTAEIVEAAGILHDAGEDSADIWAGDPDGDHHKTGQMVFARRRPKAAAADVLAEMVEGREGMLAAWLDRSPVGWRVIPLVRGHRTAAGYVARLDVLDALVSKTLPPDAISLERAQALMERAQAITRIYSSDAIALARRFDDAGCRVDDEITSTARRARAAVLAVLPGVA